MLYASGFASLTSSTTTVSNAMRSVRQLFETSGAPTVIAKMKKKKKKRPQSRRLGSEKEERLVQILGKPITSEHIVFKASMDRANCALKKNTNSTSGMGHHEPTMNDNVFAQGKNKKKLTAKQIKKVKRRKAKRKKQYCKTSRRKKPNEKSAKKKSKNK